MPLLLPLDYPDAEAYVPPPWSPTLDEIAEHAPSYTRGGFDDDRPSAGSERLRFSEDTSPTAEHVQGLIRAACNEVAGRCGATIRTRQYGLARTAAKWLVVAVIVTGKRAESPDRTTDEYRNYLATVNELVHLVRMGPTRLA